MIGYGHLLLPLIRKLKREFKSIESPWYTDDGSAAGKLKDILIFFRRLCELGSAYEYFSEEIRVFLLHGVWRESGGNFRIKNGFRYLRRFIGEKREIEWVEKKITNGIKAVESVAELIKYASQSAYAGMQRTLSVRVDFYPTGGSEYWYFVQ